MQEVRFERVAADRMLRNQQQGEAARVAFSALEQLSRDEQVSGSIRSSALPDRFS
jgi:hypothetical protein